MVLTRTMPHQLCMVSRISQFLSLGKIFYNTGLLTENLPIREGQPRQGATSQNAL